MKKLILASLITLLIAEAVAGQMNVTQTVHANVVQPDVAYLYRQSSKINPKIINVLEEMNFNVTLINEQQLSYTNLTKYRLVFVGDENFLKAKKIPAEQVPTLVFNHYNVKDFGLTDRDGASQLGSSSPLTINMGNQSVLVYIKAFKEDRIGLHYYYLDKNNIADSLTQVAYTKTTSSGRKFGAVITHAEPGDLLLNGKIAQQKICFFGITETIFWTPEAESLFEDCVRFTVSV